MEATFSTNILGQKKWKPLFPLYTIHLYQITTGNTGWRRGQLDGYIVTKQCSVTDTYEILFVMYWTYDPCSFLGYLDFWKTKNGSISDRWYIIYPYKLENKRL